MTALTSFDPRSPELMDDPYPEYRWITGKGQPVYSPKADCWMYGHYDLCERALADAQTYSVARGVQFEDDEDLPEGIPLLTLTDPPEHTRLRRFMAYAFKADTVQRFAEAFRENMVASIGAVSSGSLDVMADLIMPWSIENSLTLLEVPDADRGEWRSWMAEYFRRERGNLGFTKAGDAALTQAMIYLINVHLGHLREDGDSFLRRILRHEVDGERMSDEEALGLLMTMAVVGAEDTARTFANILLHLDRSMPPAAGLGEKEAYAVIDETIRYAPSTHYVRRTTTRDVEENGVVVPAGSKLLVLFGAANRDPAVFTDPDVFDPGRGNSQRALGFSRGAHSCLGIHVARLQLLAGLQVVLEKSTERDIDYEHGEWVHAMNISGYQRLPGSIRWK
ncbi:cytochrome P450 [Actinocorallia populi]|uniref:cytochrome P450 n=1 Tax=Actinocorallia populi TaxID=2079200 RepID=UPI000D089067|nr:cytochrome P450 [Actinocorallia populi]